MITLLAGILVAGASCAGGQIERNLHVNDMQVMADAKPQPDVVLRGSVTGQENQTWRLVPFDVPPGTTRITVDFDYTTREARTTVDLGLLGPDGFRGQDGFRGWSGGNKRTFTVSATDATPSYLPGAIRPGSWNLLLGIPNIRPESKAVFTAEIRFERAGCDRAAPAEPVVRAEPGWYRGDLHMHTAHSDGSCLSRRQQRVPCPLFLTAKAATERGLDFIAITDHNTLSHADAMRELQPYFDDLLLIPGREITTFQGHANLFGSVAMLDFRVGSAEVPDWNTLLANIQQVGGVISVNHPIRPSGEQCMGCGWTPHEPLDYGRMQAVEVVNGLDADTPFSGVKFWEHLLDEGYQLTALGGSDNHDALSGTIGTPTTVLYADMLSQAGVVAAIRRGRVFIDVAGTRDRSLDLTARVDGQSAHMGETLRGARGALVRFEGSVSGVAGGQVEVILDGQRVSLLKDARVASTAQSFEFPWRADGKRHWVRLDVRDALSHLVLIGNPIYLR
ncbi:MAG: CehA/McbA family metallohydrolase [Steroidobacteraceae bacterium]